MNMLPGDSKALSPSGLRIGVPELTRVGMGVQEMEEVAGFYHDVLIAEKDPKSVKERVREFKKEFQVIGYCFNEDKKTGYPL